MVSTPAPLLRFNKLIFFNVFNLSEGTASASNSSTDSSFTVTPLPLPPPVPFALPLFFLVSIPILRMALALPTELRLFVRFLSVNDPTSCCNCSCVAVDVSGLSKCSYVNLCWNGSGHFLFELPGSSSR